MLKLVEASPEYLDQYKEAYLLSIGKIESGEVHPRNLMFHNPDEVDVVQKMQDTRDKTKLKPNRVLSYDYIG